MSKAPTKPKAPQRPASAPPPPQPTTISVVAVDDLVPNPRNPRKHSDEQLDHLKASLRRDGQTKPVLVRKANMMLIAGHGVTAAAKRLALPTINAILWDIDQATADRVMLADNRLGDLSEDDNKRVGELLREIDEADYFATGFSADDAAKMFAKMQDELRVVEIETKQVADDFWINVRGPLASQAQVFQRLKQVLMEFPDVQVDHGTVNRDG